MKPAYRMILLSTFLSFPLLCFAISPDPPPGKINQFKTAIAQDKTGAQFDYSAKVTKSIGKSVITFTPATLQTGASLKVLENGFLLGEWTTNSSCYLNTQQQESLPPGTYQIWLARPGQAWTIFATDSNGKVLVSTTNVRLDLNENDIDGFIPKIAHIFIPPYPPVKAEPTFHPTADEGPGTVHGCQCHDVTHCVDDAGGDGGRRRTICWTEQVCNCWNTGR